MMKTFRPFFSPPEVEPELDGLDELEEHAAARTDTKTSAASSGSALLPARPRLAEIGILPLADAVEPAGALFLPGSGTLIDESFQLMAKKAGCR
jgi:hypothetical protein